jgi:hypothetical protein
LFALVLVIAALLCGLGWWLASSAPDVAIVAPIESPPGAPTEQAGDGDPALEPAGTRAPVTRQAPESLAQSTDGDLEGTIFVSVRLADGRTFDGPWTLEIEEEHYGRGGPWRPRQSLQQTTPAVSIPARSDGIHLLCASASGLASKTVRCDLDKAHPAAEIVLTLDPAARVVGTVVDADGHVVSNMQVWLVPSPAVDRRETTSFATPLPIQRLTDSAGTFRVEGLVPDTWSVLAGDRDSPLARAVNIVIAARETRLEPVVLPRLHSAVVRVKDEHGAVVSGASVTSKGPRGGSIAGVTDANGELVCEGLPAGQWRVFASAPDGSRANVSAVVPGADIQIMLRPRPRR